MARKVVIVLSAILLAAVVVFSLIWILQRLRVAQSPATTDKTGGSGGQSAQTAGIPANSGNSEAALRTEILTWTNLDRAIRQLKLDANLKTAADWQNKYETLRKAITIKTAAQGHDVILIEIAVSDASPVIAQRIANAVADNYVEETAKAAHDNDTVKVQNEAGGLQVEIIARALVPTSAYNLWGEYRASALLRRKSLGGTAR